MGKFYIINVSYFSHCAKNVMARTGSLNAATRLTFRLHTSSPLSGVSLNHGSMKSPSPRSPSSVKVSNPTSSSRSRKTICQLILVASANVLKDVLSVMLDLGTAQRLLLPPEESMGELAFFSEPIVEGLTLETGGCVWYSTLQKRDKDTLSCIVSD